MQYERDSWYAPRLLIKKFRDLWERVLFWSVGFQFTITKEWTVFVPINMIGARKMPESQKENIPEILTENFQQELHRTAAFTQIHYS